MKLFFMKTLFFIILLCSQTWAGDKPLKLTLKDSAGEDFKLTLAPSINHLGQREVRIEARGLPRLNDSINPLLGFGRDTNDNGKVDTWFFITKSGMDVVTKEGQDSLGKDVLGTLLRDKYRSTFTMYVSSATTSLLSYLMMSANEGKSAEEDFFRDYMDLEENRLAFEKNLDEMTYTMTRQQMQFHYEMQSLGYKEIANRMERFGKLTFWGYALADIGLWITGSYVVKWVGKILYRTSLIASEIAFVNTLKETFIGFFEKQKSNITAKIAAYEEKMSLSAKSKKAAPVLTLTKRTWRQALTNTIKARQMKGRILHSLLKTAQFAKKSAVAAAREWKYIAMNSSVQISAEAFARYDQIKDPNPAVMAQNLLSNEEVIQNVSFMAAESIMMTGVSKNLNTTKARYMASSAVALTNSSIMNLAIKDNPDPYRVAFDTAWEMIIGNSQVQLDLKALEYFEKMALKKNNPKIKLVGYVVALVDMGVGYVIYSKATSALNKEKKESESARPEPKVMLIPVLAEG